jgi:hypothetical protein
MESKRGKVEGILACHIKIQEDACARTGKDDDDEETLQRQLEDIQDEDCDLDTETCEIIGYIFNHLYHCNEIWSFVIILSIKGGVKTNDLNLPPRQHLRRWHGETHIAG